MKKCSLCKEKDAIAKVKWIGKESVKTTSYPCIDCFIKLGKAKKDVKEFDRILTMCESKGFDNVDRIYGRLEYQKFAKRFTKKDLDEMAKKIGAKRTR